MPVFRKEGDRRLRLISRKPLTAFLILRAGLGAEIWARATFKLC